MKKFVSISVIASLIMIFQNSFRLMQEGVVMGKITPNDAAIAILAINKTDTVNTAPANGIFTMKVKAGTCKLIVDARPPFKDTVLENIKVVENVNTDVGEIKLSQ